MTVLIVDLAVICDDRQRRELLPDWEAYHAALVDDPCHFRPATLVNAMRRMDYLVVAITDRPVKWAEPTTQWLMGHRIMIDQVDFRATGDFRPGPEFLAEKLEDGIKAFSSPSESVIALVASDAMVEIARANGAFALQAFSD